MKRAGKGPPSLAIKLIHAFLRRDLAEEVIGDLIEQHTYIVGKSGSSFKADLNSWYQTLNYLRPFALRRIRTRNPTIMYKSYVKTTIRGMSRNKLHAFINISGLSVGLAVAITIGLWIRDEMSYERNFENHDQIGRVIQNVTNNGEVQTWWSIPFPLAEELRKNYGSDFRHVVLSTYPYQQLLRTDSVRLMKQGMFVEHGFAEMFTLNMLRGTREDLDELSAIFLSASAARTYFGDADPIGKAMTIGTEMNVHVAGVFEDIPEQSQFFGLEFISTWALLDSHERFAENFEDPWRPNSFIIYVQLNGQSTFESASVNIRDAKLRKVSPELAKKKPELFIHPMDKWHLYSDFRNGKLQGGRIQYVWLFGIVGAFVMLMACINFMNLSTARSERRAKEVGIRKAIGSFRSQLITQFFSESIITAFMALVIALLTVKLILPWFNEISGKHISLPWTNPWLWVIALSFCALTGIIAGSYPALYLSSIRSGNALKGSFKGGRAATLPRKVLVVVQFTVSVALIIGTFVVFLQVKYAQQRPIGYETNGLIAVPYGSQEVHCHFDAIKTQLLNDGSIIEMAESEAPTTGSWSSSSRFDWRGKDPDLSVDFPFLGVSHDYGRAIGWHITDGRDFSREFLSDSSAIVINEAAAHFMGFKSAVDEIVTWGGQPLKVVGVVADIVAQSPYEPVRPTIYYLRSGASNYLILRLNPEKNAQSAIANIEKAVKPHIGDQPFTYEFADEQYGRKFDSEGRIGTLAGIFSSLAIFISCLGTFGLSSFVAEQRTKEIGVRKVMGASRFQLWQLMSRELTLLVIAACVIAVPVAYSVLSSWLSGYSYRTPIPIWTLITATIGTLLITLATASWHTLQAASVNPVKSLRAE